MTRLPEQDARLRRGDRAMPDDAAIQSFLQRSLVSHLATSVDDQPYLIPSLFWYDAGSGLIFYHGAIEGRTRRNLEQNPRVCIAVSEVGRFLPAATAMQFSNEFASVVIFGRASLVLDEQEKRRALQGILDKYFPALKTGEDYRPITSAELERTAVYAVVIESWSGKQKVVE